MMVSEQNRKKIEKKKYTLQSKLPSPSKQENRIW